MADHASQLTTSPDPETGNPGNGFDDLFPMKLTSIERFHLFDEEPDYPNVVFGKLTFEPPIDIELAKQAWQLALHPHPFANVQPKAERSVWGTRWNWQGKSVANRQADAWEHSRIEELTQEQAENWSAKRHTCPSVTGCYLGIYSGTADSVAQVVFCIHHAVADGIACLRTINDWLVVYNNLRSGRAPMEGTARVDASQMRVRNRLGLLTWRYLKHLPFQAIALFGASKFIFRRTAPAIPEEPDSRPAPMTAVSESSEPFPAIVGAWFSQELTRKLEQAAGRLKVTSTSLLLACWFDTLGQVRRERTGKPSTDEWIRVILPMSIRSYADRRIPASNRTAIVQIDRQVPDEHGFSQYVKMIHRETGIIKRFQLEKMFLIAIRLFGISNRFLKRMAANDQSRGAAVFTDLHRPFLPSQKRQARWSESVDSKNGACDRNVDFIQPIDFELSGPIRRGTPLNLSCCRFRGRMKVCLHYDTLRLNRGDADSILAKLEASVRSRIASIELE